MDAVAGPFASYSYLQPLLISVAGTICSYLAMVIYHLLVQRFCFRTQANTSSQYTPSAQLKNGVDQELLSKIPILTYSTRNGDVFRLDQSECPICLCELEDGELVRLLPPCKHDFHVPCIDGWFTTHSNCPICRSPINSESIMALASENDAHERLSEVPSLQSDQQIARDLSASTLRFHWEGGLLWHSVSVRSHRDKKPLALVMGLKRSLSVDQSYIAITIQNAELEKASFSSAKGVGFSQSKYFRARSLRHFDHVCLPCLQDLSHHFGVVEVGDHRMEFFQLDSSSSSYLKSCFFLVKSIFCYIRVNIIVGKKIIDLFPKICFA